jgi:hypothetical protein
MRHACKKHLLLFVLLAAPTAGVAEPSQRPALAAAQQHNAQRFIQGAACAVQRGDALTAYSWFTLADLHGKALGGDATHLWGSYFIRKLGATDAKKVACADVPAFPGRIP